MWGTVNCFMNWKKSETPNQIIVNNVLYCKAKDVAKHMNECFITKVNKLRESFSENKPNLEN